MKHYAKLALLAAMIPMLNGAVVLEKSFGDGDKAAFFDGRKALAKGSSVKIPRENLLSEEQGRVTIDFYPDFADDAPGKLILSPLLAVKSSKPPTFAGFHMGLNFKDGKFYPWIIVSGEKKTEIYREAEMVNHRWYQLTAAWDAKELRLYLDGRLLGKTAKPAIMFVEKLIDIGGVGTTRASCAIAKVTIDDTPQLPPDPALTLPDHVIVRGEFTRNTELNYRGAATVPADGRGRIADSALQADDKDFRRLSYPEIKLPEAEGELSFDFRSNGKAAAAQEKRNIQGPVFAFKSAAPPDYCGIQTGFNYNSNGQVYAWVIVATPQAKGQIYREFPLEDGRWYHVRVTWSKAVISLFIDGKCLGETARISPLFPTDAAFTVGGYGGNHARGEIRNLEVRDQLADGSPLSQIDWKFAPGTTGEAAIFENPAIASNDRKLSFCLKSLTPLTLRIRDGIFPIKPNQGYAVNFSAHPHMFLKADADGVLEIPLEEFFSYNTILIVPSDVTNAASEAGFKGSQSREMRFTMGWGHEGKSGVQAEKLPEVIGEVTPTQRCGREALLLEKYCTGGELYATSDFFVLKPRTEYILSAEYSVDEPAFGAVATLALEEKNGAKISQNFLNPLIAPTQGRKWRYAYLRMTTGEKATAGRMVLSLRGAPQKIYWSNLAVRLAPPEVNSHAKDLSAQEKKAKYSVEEIRRMFAARPASTAEIRRVNGFPVLYAGGKPIPNYSYNNYIVSSASSEAPNMLRAGVRWFYVPATANRTWWKGEGQYDFSGIQANLENLLKHDPDAVVMLTLRISPSFYEWGEKNPDAVWRGPEQEKVIRQKTRPVPADAKLKDKDDFWMHSYAAEEFRQSAARAIEALVRHLDTIEVGKAVVGINFWCGTDNQWFPHINYYGHDYSKAAERDFRSYLRQIYGNDVARLKAAWQDERVTFETATLSPHAERTGKGSYLDGSVGTEKQAIDSNIFNDAGTMYSANYLARVAKKAFGKPVVINLDAPDIFQGYSGRAARRLLLEGDAIDSLVSVPEYGAWRQPGRTGSLASAVSSISLHNKMMISELDYRTNSCWNSPDAFHYFYYQWGGVLDEEELAGQIRRDMGTLLAQGGGGWQLAMNYIQFHSKRSQEIVAEVTRASAAAADRPMGQDRAQIAFFVDENLRNVSSYDFAKGINNVTSGLGKIPVWRSGCSADFYYLSDAVNPDLPKYKVYFFAGSPSISPEEIAYIRQNLQKDGNVLIFMGPAGITAGFKNFPENIFKLTGIKVKFEPETIQACRVLPNGSRDAMAEGLRDNMMTEYSQPLCYIDDPEATVFGRIYGSPLGGWAVKRFKDWTSVYISVSGAVTPELIRNCVKAAGMEPIGPLNDMTTAGNGFVTIHAIHDGDKVLNLPPDKKYRDLIDNRVISIPADGKLQFPMKAGQTRWFREI